MADDLPPERRTHLLNNAAIILSRLLYDQVPLAYRHNAAPIIRMITDLEQDKQSLLTNSMDRTNTVRLLDIIDRQQHCLMMYKKLLSLQQHPQLLMQPCATK